MAVDANAPKGDQTDVEASVDRLLEVGKNDPSRIYVLLRRVKQRLRELARQSDATERLDAAVNEVYEEVLSACQRAWHERDELKDQLAELAKAREKEQHAAADLVLETIGERAAFTIGYRRGLSSLEAQPRGEETT